MSFFREIISINPISPLVIPTKTFTDLLTPFWKEKLKLVEITIVRRLQKSEKGGRGRGPQGAEKQLRKVYVGGGWLVGGMRGLP